ncbi:MAG TPA: hypothetical protein DCL13_00660, partial [Peptococcaceae bacterium]|nr:hypothetical protein [Peptococcaceae bacterium]
MDYLDLLERAGFWQLQEEIARATGLAVITADAHGRLVLRKSNLSPFCTLINSTYEGKMACETFRRELVRAALPAGKCQQRVCHAGLVNLGAPVGGRVVLIAGGVAVAPLKERKLARLAEEVRCPRDKLRELARQVPVWSEARLAEAGGLIQAMASFAARSLDGYRMFAHVLRLGELIAAEHDEQVVVARAVRETARVLDVPACLLCTYDEEKKVLVARGAHGVDGAVLEAVRELPVDDSVVGAAFKAGQPVAVPDVRAAGGEMLLPRLVPELRSALVVPLRARGRTLGTLGVYATAPRAWDETTAGYLTAIAAKVALALENARLYSSFRETEQELQRKVDELTALFEFTRTVSRSLQVSEVAQRALEAVLGLTGATSGSVVMLDEVTPEITTIETAATVEPCHEFRVVPAGEIVAAVRREARAAHFNSRADSDKPEEKRPAVAIPLMVGGKVTGVLTIAGRPEGARFTEEEAVFLISLGASLGLALENARLFRQLQARATMLERLLEVGQLISGSLDVNEVLTSALASFRDVLGVGGCVLRLLDEETGELVLKASLGLSAELQARVSRVRPEGTLLEKVLQTGKPVVVGDVTASEPGMRPPYYAADMRAVASVPVRAGKKILGTLTVYHPTPHHWKEEEVGYLATIASQTGLALENARLYSSLKDYYMSVLQALAAALEAKDTYTRGHSVRVARLARACARTLGLGAEEQEQVYFAALLHDVGKIGVPESILLKPGPLSAEEWKEVQNHPVVGARILEPARFPGAVVAAVRYHHEDYGGGGYPDGLTGDEIPLLARVIRVADAYDAMTSARSYRRPFTPEEAREELRRGAGRQFDPR